MSAFKPKVATASSLPRAAPGGVPRTREEFIAVFGESIVVQVEGIVEDSIRQITASRSFFRERDVVRGAQRLAENEKLDEKILGHAHFRDLIESAFRQHPMVELDSRGTITTPLMWEMEQAMLAMAGETTTRHLLPSDIVDAALASRSWISAHNLPEDVVAATRARYAGLDQNLLLVKHVAETARTLGYDVFGAGLSWNREGATGLADEVAGEPAEFIEAITAARSEGPGKDWFIKPTLFIGDAWGAAEGKQLRALAAEAALPVHCVSREGISDEQVDAVIAACLVDKRVSVIEGTAGAGKSFTMKSVCEAYKACGYDVMGAALGWSAAKVLSGSTGLPEKSCRAMEGFLRSMRKAQTSGAQFFSRPTVIIVDEAGMVGTVHMHDLLEMTRNSIHPIKIVLTGDSLQVAPVSAGNALEAIIDFYGTTRIDTIRRQKQASHRAAVKRFSYRQSGQALYPFVQQEAIRWSKDQQDLFNSVVRDFVSYRAAFPDKKALVLALKNDDVNELNRRIREVYKKAGFIDPNEVNLEVTDGRVTWRAGFSVGDEVVLRANDQNLPVYYIPDPSKSSLFDESTWLFKTTGVFNRNSGRIVAIRRSANPAGSYDFVIDLEGDDPARVVVNSQKFKHENKSGMPMVHNFATTIYASQGQTVNKVLLIDSERMNFRLSYVGMSRHTESVDVYVDETDLHVRLDRMMGKSPSRPVGEAGTGQLATELGRYTRAEMLQTVALAWGQEADNLTATIYEKRTRLRKNGQEAKKASPEDLARVAPGAPGEPVIDFLPTVNVRYPMVDIEQILAMPDPVGESEFVRPADVQENRAAIPTYESPVRLRATTDLPELPSKKASAGLLSSAISWLGSRLGHDTPATSAASPARQAGSRSTIGTGAQEQGHVKPPSAFAEVLDRVETHVEEDGVLVRMVDFVASLVPRPKGLSALPLLPVPPSVGRVDEAGVLRFDDVPQTRVPEGVPNPGPSDAFLSSPRGKVWWDVGRGGEPRVIARSPRGEVQARYRLDGTCVVGEGYPPIAYAPKPNQDTPLHIVPGPREWFLVQEMYAARFQENPDQQPHVAWGAPDVDWSPFRESLKGRKIVILRSKHDDRQIPWAIELQKELSQRWRLDAEIAPPVPPEAIPATPSPAAEPVARRGRRP